MTSTQIMQRILLWGGILAAAVAVIGGVVGWFLAAGAGVASALVGTALAIIFCMLTAGSILLALKVSKGEMVSGAFFGIVLGGWLVKFALFIVLVFVLGEQSWLHRGVAFGSLVAAVIGTRKMKLIPTRGQSLIEMGLGFVRDGIAYDLLGEKDGKRFLPIITTIFFMVLAMNLTGVIPFLNIAGTAVIGVPLVLAVVSYVAFIYAGIKKHPGAFFKNSLFPAGVPWPLYIIVTPMEFISTFVLRPITLTLRLMMNLLVGHLMLVLFFSATHFFLLSAGGLFPALSVGTLAFGFAFTVFELLVAVLQAYVFAILTAVYIQLALAEEH